MHECALARAQSNVGRGHEACHGLRHGRWRDDHPGGMHPLHRVGHSRDVRLGTGGALGRSAQMRKAPYQ